jgi:hypothetical protein
MASTAGGNLIRYGSAPSSLLLKAVDSSRFGAEAATTSGDANIEEDLQRSYCFNNLIPSNDNNNNNNNQFKINSNGSNLSRRNSSPADFLNRLAASDNDDEFDRYVSVSRGLYNQKMGCDMSSSTARGVSRLNSQHSFTKDNCLSQITEESTDNDDDGCIKDQDRRAYSTTNFEMMTPWDDANGSIFPNFPSKRAKSTNPSHISNSFNIVDSQLHFGSGETALEMATFDNLLDIPQDSVTCKARAKRGCATHPRSIAERERRTRISGKLKKLQDLVPNMDKQTSYADMLDLAVQHIKGLQTQVQKLHKEAENCTCGCGSKYE